MLSLLNEKFMPAALPEVCVSRRRLLNLFHKAAQGRFTYVGAPAGSGKTVSALLWLAACGRQAVWIGLDAYDNAPSVFYKQLATGIYSTQPENANMRSILTDPAFSSSPVEHTVYLLSELTPNDRLYALALDDIHLITNQEIIKSLPAVLRRLPYSFVVLLLSRNRLPEEYRELIKDEKNQVIDGGELRFSQEEIRQYFNSLGRSLSPEEARFAQLITGGWAIGVTAIAKSGNIELGQAGYGFERYLKEHLWEKWDEGLREFMLKTSVVDEMTEELARALTGRQDSGAVLQELCAQNSFISRTGGGVYRYHHLFLEFLRGMAKGRGRETAALNRIAAEYYLAAGQYLTARRYAVKSGDIQVVMQMIYRFTQYTNPSLDEYVAFSRVFNKDELTEEVCERYPFLYTTHLYVAYLSGNAKRMEYYLDKLYRHLDLIAKEFPQFLEMVILEITLDHRTPFSRQIEKFSALPPITYRNESQQGASITLQMPFLHRSNRDYYELADEKIMAKLSETFAKLLREHFKITRPCLAAGFLLEKNRLEEALTFALEAKEMTGEIQSPEFIFAAHMHLAAVYYAMGEEELLKEVFQETETRIEAAGAHYLGQNFLAYKTRLRLWNGDKSAAGEWLKNYFVTQREQIPLYKVFQYFTTARAYMVLDQPEKALEVLRKLRQLAEDFRRPLDIAEARMLEACLEWAAGSRREAAATLEEVLLTMQPHGFIRIVADEGSAVTPVLKRVLAKVNQEGYRGGLTRAYVTEVLLAAHGVSKLHQGVTANMVKSRKPVNLSRQQRHMIGLLAQGYKNSKIAEISGLAVPTVKGHLMLAYEKLGVNNAMDAVLKARELGIIE